jgi:hypothetical protein
VVRVSIAADDNLRVLAPHADLEYSDLLNILAGPHAPGAKDTGTHVMLDHDVAGTLISTSKGQLVVGADGNLVLNDVALELIPGMGRMVATIGARG